MEPVRQLKLNIGVVFQDISNNGKTKIFMKFANKFIRGQLVKNTNGALLLGY